MSRAFLEPGWHAGATVKIFGLVKAAQHNGKIGKISAKPAEEAGRIGVDLGNGQVLAVKRENLELAGASAAEDAAMEKAAAEAAAMMDENKQRTLTRNNALLEEFDGSRDPDVLALYYHYNDRAMDCFNAPEYNSQMLRYYSKDITVVAVVPRRIRDNDYFLVCLQHKEAEKNTLCEVAFQCSRQFAGISMLVKKRCFVCNRPGASMCVCQCACFCSKECKASAVGEAHREVCKLVRASSVTVEDESIQLF